MIERKTGFYIAVGFLAGVLLTLGFKDVYPDLERRFRDRRRRLSAVQKRKSIAWTPAPSKVTLEDHTNDGGPRMPTYDIPVGIEGCIGNTPLFKIKSLSEATGCEILAKAEVGMKYIDFTPLMIQITCLSSRISINPRIIVSQRCRPIS